LPVSGLPVLQTGGKSLASVFIPRPSVVKKNPCVLLLKQRGSGMNLKNRTGWWKRNDLIKKLEDRRVWNRSERNDSREKSGGFLGSQPIPEVG
jgi:hypothetical protein